jgi:solute:Na+ symporter, SSS family
MSPQVIYILLVLVYFVFLIGIGIVSKRKTKSTSDYHLGGRQIGAIVSSFSFVAAYFSSVIIIGGGALAYRFGMATIWVASINVVLGCFLAWAVLGRRTRAMTAKLNAVTLPDFFAKRYQLPFARVFVSIVVCLFMIFYNISILKALGETSHVLLNIPYVWGVVLSGLIVLIYVSFGGYLAVVWTGFIQAIIMGAGLLLMLSRTLAESGGMTKMVADLRSINVGLVDTPGLWGYPGLISFTLVVSLGVWGMPQMLARFYSIKNNQAIRIGTIFATVGAMMAFIPFIAGAYARVRFPGLANADLAIPTLVNSLMSPWAVAIFFVGVIAAGMSTFSSVLIITSGAMVRDLFKTAFSVTMNEKKELRWTTLTNVLVGIVSIIIALKPPGLVAELIAFSWTVIAATCLAPFLLGLYWNGTTRNGALASMVGGFIVSLSWMALKQPFGLHGFIPGVGISFVLLIVVSLMGKDKVAMPL